MQKSPSAKGPTQLKSGPVNNMVSKRKHLQSLPKVLIHPDFFFNSKNPYNIWFYIGKIDEYIYKTIIILKDKHNKTQ